jgi:hypothetical protein
MSFDAALIQEGLVSVKTSDNRDLVFVSGHSIVDFRGGASEFKRDRVNILVGPIWEKVDSVAPIISLATVYDDGPVSHPGWGIDDTRWSVLNGQVRLDGQIAAIGSGALLIRLACYATIIGKLA